MTLARSVRSVYIRWGVGVGIMVGIATVAAFAGAIVMLVLPGERTVFAAVAAGLIFLSIPVVWWLVLRSAGRSFKRVFAAHGCDDAGPRSAQCAGWVFLMHIAMTIMLILLAVVVG
jgi:hypothetical protein